MEQKLDVSAVLLFLRATKLEAYSGVRPGNVIWQVAGALSLPGLWPGSEGFETVIYGTRQSLGLQDFTARTPKPYSIVLMRALEQMLRNQPDKILASLGALAERGRRSSSEDRKGWIVTTTDYPKHHTRKAQIEKLADEVLDHLATGGVVGKALELLGKFAQNPSGMNKQAFGWNAVDDPEVKDIFNRIRDALAIRPLYFVNHSIGHSPDGRDLSVDYKFQSPKNGKIELRWHLSPDQVQRIREAQER